MKLNLHEISKKLKSQRLINDISNSTFYINYFSLFNQYLQNNLRNLHQNQKKHQFNFLFLVNHIFTSEKINIAKDSLITSTPSVGPPQHPAYII